MQYCSFLWDVSPIANTSFLGHPKKMGYFEFPLHLEVGSVICMSTTIGSLQQTLKRNYKTDKWVGCAAVWLHGLTASVEGQSDSLSMQPFIMQRLIIISCLLISHWHIAFLNVSTNSPCLPPLPSCAGEPSLHPAHSYDDGSALALNVQPSPLPLGNSGSGITDRWPGYCCLWYLLVNFCNQYNISQQSPWEWKPETVHLILKPAPALCSAAKLGSWPTWCGIIAAEVRCELSHMAPDEWLFLIKRLSHPTRDI